MGTSSLKRAVEDIYVVFQDVPRPTSVDGCPCCIEQKGISILLSKSLRDLSPDELAKYAASAFLTVGEVDDFLYFLPRILEILATQPYWWPSPEVVARAIDTAGFRSWPDSRHHAVLRYFEEVITTLLATKDSGFELDSWICALGMLPVDVAPFLARIVANPARLIEFYEANSQQLVEGRLSNSFWDESSPTYKLVIEWFQSADTRKTIELQYGIA